MRKVAVIAIGYTKVKEHWGLSIRDLFTEAAIMALNEVTIDRVDALYVGNMSSGYCQHQEHLGALMADYIGLKSPPAVKIEAAGASGGMALREGIQAVASGLHDFVVVGGVEKMSDVLTPDITYAMAMAADQEYEAFIGVTFTALNAMIKRAYQHKFGVSDELIATLPVHCHDMASKNPYAQYPFKITIEQVLSSPFVAEPLRLLECSSPADGAAILILCPLEKAKKFTDTPIEIAGIGAATDTIALYQRDDFTTFKATIEAANMAYKMAHIKPEEVDVAEIHDSFSITGVISLEDLGFFKKGTAAKAISEGEIAPGGKIAVNTFGGLKARGHPVGATGVYQVVEVVKQLRGEAGKNQVDDAETGLTQNIGGVGGTVTVYIFRRID
ncbi:MAG: thiolase domain-containing protein [Candidatus Baldrarchaeota archaeon]